MAKMSDLSRKLRLFLHVYRFHAVDHSWATPSVPVSEARVALVSTAGFVRQDQERFSDRVRGGDPSYRILDADTAVASLIECHRSESFDHRAIAADANAGFPLDRLRELEAAGIIGEIAPRHLSFMGSITRTRPLRDTSAPAAAELLVADGVDVALLVPV